MDNGRVFERLFRGIQTHTQEPPEDSFGNVGSAFPPEHHSSIQEVRSDFMRFPLSNYLVDVEQEVRPPRYVEQQPFKDMSAVSQSGSGTYTHVDILDGEWPNDATSDLDASQLAALRRILTKELAIVQGPPGTGTLNRRFLHHRNANSDEHL